MAVWTQYSDDDPLFRVQGRPIYVTELLLILYVTAFVAVVFANALGGPLAVWLGELRLSTGGVLRQGKVWQLLTYPFVNQPSFGFALQMAMLFWFGREVERTVGRRAYLLLYAGLAVLPAVLLLGISLATGRSITFTGSSNLHFSLFVAFALLFPGAPVFFGVAAKWVALILVALSALISIAYRDWIDLAVLGAGVAVAAFAIRVPFLSELVEWARERRAESVRERRRQEAAAKRQVEERRAQSIDAVLDKISREGMRSLTKDEKAVLEKARLELLKKEGK